MTKLSKEPYKGVRDFYPEQQFTHQYLFDVMRGTAESYGYVGYDASVLEPADLYKQKSGEEIINEQTYTFVDRGDREVTLRPEMTPTVARMVAAKRRDYTMPLRWYSIPNLFRYERPQRGRLREHWQLNVDLFGVDSLDADIEIIAMASQIMKNFGMNEEDFEVQINNRKLVNKYLSEAGLDEEQMHAMQKLIDKKAKIDNFDEEAKKIAGEDFSYDLQPDEDVKKVLKQLEEMGVNNAVFKPEIMRGFDYYTGIVFEVFDKHPDNNRAIFGGGRYDDLLDIFGEEKIPAFGFGMGDVMLEEVLRTYDLLPEYTPATDIYICTLSDELISDAQKLAADLRLQGLNTAVNLTSKKVGDQIKKAEKDSIPFVLVLGDDELKSGDLTLKHLESGKEFNAQRDTVLEAISNFVEKL